MERIRGIDSIRFVCAMIVVLEHLGLPVPEALVTIDSPVGRAIRGTIGCLFNGPAAVIVFFVISGFCIHFPNRKGTPLNLPAFYSKRIIRICVPAFFAILIFNYLGMKLEPPIFHIFWSVICELIYYIIYPLLLTIRKEYGWQKIVVATYLGSVLLAIVNLEKLQTAYKSYGALGWFTWVIGLPCWILGCWLAENYSRFSLISSRQIWLLRAGVFFIGTLTKMAAFHVDFVVVSLVFTLNAFAFLITIWLGFEIVYYQKKQPSTVLEWSGRWSYSLYMIHPTVPAIILLIGIDKWSTLDIRAVWIIASLVFSYIFFLLVEKPSHQLAMYVGKRLKGMQSPIIVGGSASGDKLIKGS